MTALDNPVWHSLAGHQDRFALTVGRARRYDPEVALFCGLPDEPTPDDWTDLARVLAGAPAFFFAVAPIAVPREWTVSAVYESVQMVATRPVGSADPDIVALGAADVSEMLEQIGRAHV